MINEQLQIKTDVSMESQGNTHSSPPKDSSPLSKMMNIPCDCHMCQGEGETVFSDTFKSLFSLEVGDTVKMRDHIRVVSRKEGGGIWLKRL